MTRIAVCDDDRGFCNVIKGYIESLLTEFKSRDKVESIYSGSDLIDNFEEYSLIFLDIDMLGRTSLISHNLIGEYLVLNLRKLPDKALKLTELRLLMASFALINQEASQKSFGLI